MRVLYFLFILLSFSKTSSASSFQKHHLMSSTGYKTVEEKTIPFLQSELSSCTTAQNSILSFLHAKRISIGMSPGLLRRQSQFRPEARVVVSTEDNPVSCRIALGRAPAGSICVAPCGCSGSQKWVQFSELNRLRRIDPAQWAQCKTCQQPFNYKPFESHAGPVGGIIGFVLDNKVIIRGLCVALSSLLAYSVSLHLWVARLLTSQVLWNNVS
jgi:hypothetical protein